jgi:tetratricopeptide (TPR) repeat protein
VLAAPAAAPAAAQIPETYTNLKVLPKTITKPEIVAIMRGWATDLGLRCHNCHVGPDNLQGMDFASDEKPTKRAAREMARMVEQINTGAMKALPPADAPRQSVGCYTCHRGAGKPPEALHVELVRSAEAGGGAAAVERYRELRREHGENGRYDFSPRGLIIAASRLGEMQRLDDALALARLNVEVHPTDAGAHAALGDVLLRHGDRGGATASYRQALAIDPENGSAKRGLAQALAQPPATPPKQR